MASNNPEQSRPVPYFVPGDVISEEEALRYASEMQDPLEREDGKPFLSPDFVNAVWEYSGDDPEAVVEELAKLGMQESLRRLNECHDETTTEEGMSSWPPVDDDLPNPYVIGLKSWLYRNRLYKVYMGAGMGLVGYGLVPNLDELSMGADITNLAPKDIACMGLGIASVYLAGTKIESV